MRYIFTSIICFYTICTDIVKAQDSLNIYHLSVMINPIQLPDDSAGTFIEPTEAEVKIVFKISDLAKVSSAYIKIGNNKNDGPFKSESLKVVSDNGFYYLKDADNNLYKIWGKSAYYSFKISLNDVQKILWTTVYLTDMTGTETEKRYFKNF